MLKHLVLLICIIGTMTGLVVAQDDYKHPVITVDNVANLVEVASTDDAPFSFYIDWSPSGSRIAAAGIAGVAVYDSETVEQLWWNQNARPYDIKWSPDEQWLALAWLGYVEIWDAENGEEIQQMTHSEKTVYSVQWAPDGSQLLSLDEDGLLKIWDTETWETVRTFDEAVNVAEWSADGLWLATLDPVLKIWHVEDFSVAVQESIEGDWLHWSPDGERLAVKQTDDNLAIYDTATLSLILMLDSSRDQIITFAWSPDSTMLATVTREKRLQVWDVETGDVLLMLEDEREILDVAWSSDGTRLATKASVILHVWGIEE